MADVYAGAVLVILAACGAFLAAARLLRGRPRWVLVAAGIAAVGAVVAYQNYLDDSVALMRLLPFSNVIVLGKWLPLLAGVLGAVAWRGIGGRPWRKVVAVSALAAAALACSFGVFIGPAPACGDRWRADVCLQTSGATCSAAAAATLLRAHGISATEQEMAALCLTTNAGTTEHGLFRGLKRKTRGTEWDVEPFLGGITELRTLGKPLLLRVGLGRDLPLDRRYRERWGWAPGVAHTVVFFGFTNGGKLEIGDPSFGREVWDMAALAVLWHGGGMRLVRCRPAP